MLKKIKESERRVVLIWLVNDGYLQVEELNGFYTCSLLNCEKEKISPITRVCQKWSEVAATVLRRFDVLSYSLSDEYREKRIPEIGYHINNIGELILNSPKYINNTFRSSLYDEHKPVLQRWEEVLD